MIDDSLSQLPIFQGLDSNRLDLLRPLLKLSEYGEGEVVFEQGEPAEYFYLVVTGEVVVRYKPEDGEALNISRVRPGGLVGWSAALGSRNYTSGAFCSTCSHLVRVRGEELRNLLEMEPEIGRILLERLAAMVAERIHHSRDQVYMLLEQSLQVGPYSPEGAHRGMG